MKYTLLALSMILPSHTLIGSQNASADQQSIWTSHIKEGLVPLFVLSVFALALRYLYQKLRRQSNRGFAQGRQPELQSVLDELTLRNKVYTMLYHNNNILVQQDGKDIISIPFGNDHEKIEGKLFGHYTVGSPDTYLYLLIVVPIDATRMQLDLYKYRLVGDQSTEQVQVQRLNEILLATSYTDYLWHTSIKNVLKRKENKIDENIQHSILEWINQYVKRQEGGVEVQISPITDDEIDEERITPGSSEPSVLPDQLLDSVQMEQDTYQLLY